MMTLARGRPLLCQNRIETALPGDITPLTSPMMFHEVARQIFRLEWCCDRASQFGHRLAPALVAGEMSGSSPSASARYISACLRYLRLSLRDLVTRSLIFCRFDG